MNHQIFKIAALAGDGIGPEVMREAIKVLRAVESKFRIRFTITEAAVGWAGIDAAGHALPADTLALCRQSDAILFGSVGLPQRDPGISKEARPERAALMRLRQEFQLFANLRPVKLWPELGHVCPVISQRRSAGIDILVVRELIGGLYFGTPKGIDPIEGGQRRAVDTMVYTTGEIERIAQVAFQAAEKRAGYPGSRQPPKVTSIDKMNVLENGILWREVVTEVAQQYPRVTLEHMLVDNAAMQLMLRPSQFDVVLCENLFGDILSDEAAALAGSLGMVPSASLGATKGGCVFGLYEPAGGTAPDIAGTNSANPIAQILSAAMMLDFSFKLSAPRDAILTAIAQAIAAGNRTGDIHDASDTACKKVSTSQMGDAIAAAI